MARAAGAQVGESRTPPPEPCASLLCVSSGGSLGRRHLTPGAGGRLRSRQALGPRKSAAPLAWLPDSGSVGAVTPRAAQRPQ